MIRSIAFNCKKMKFIIVIIALRCLSTEGSISGDDSGIIDDHYEDDESPGRINARIYIDNILNSITS